MKILAVSAVLIALIVALALRSGAIAQPQKKELHLQPVPAEVGGGPLTEDGFWALIDQSASLEADPAAQLAQLRYSLDQLTADQIADFERHFAETMRRSYTWNLWGAAFLANGGASDDGFEYFRCWLISKGRRSFMAVASDPDALADLLAPGEAGGDLEFEDFAYVARAAWAAKTGRDENEMPVVADMAYDAQPTGTPFSEASEDLAKRYPKLWKRFGR